MNKVNLLSPKNRLYLIQLTCETLTRETVAEKFNRPLQFGEFIGEKFSTWEDFKIAEWRPTSELPKIFYTPVTRAHYEPFDRDEIYYK